MTEKSADEEIARVVLGIASGLATRLFDLISSGGDWTPIVELLPDVEKVRAKHELERAEARKRLEAARSAGE